MVPTAHENGDESAVRSVIYSIVKAVHAMDVEAMLAHCGPDLLTFNMAPPIQHAGAWAIRRLWETTFASFVPPLQYEVHQLDVCVSGEVAYAHCLNRFGAKHVDGRRIVNWLRSTFGLRKLDGSWKLFHEHVSVPVDLKSGKALFDVEP